MDLTCLSTFTGLGGLDLGLEAAGFRSVGCVEWDDVARRSLKANRDGTWPLLVPHDIRTIATTLSPDQLGLEVGQLSVLAGAPPCQPYSVAAQWSKGSRQGLNDIRGSYLDDFLELLEQFQPQSAMIENVQGFVRGKTSALPHLSTRLDEIYIRSGVRYQIEQRTLEAASFGVPQKRRRAIVLLLREGANFSWPDDREPRVAWDAIGHLDTPSDPQPSRGKWAELLPSIPEGQNYLWHTNRGGGQSLFGWRTRYWSFLLKLAKDAPSWTLPAQPGPATGPFHWDSRPLTVQEMLCLQTFPSDWIVEGTRQEQVRQVGNATPPLLAELLGHSLASMLDTTRSEQPELSYSLDQVRPIPGAVSPSPVPKKYLSLVGNYDDHPGPGLGPAGSS